jgi:CDP-6-deoxy-D-xylo-4-hexulose-3-dehydrase
MNAAFGLVQVSRIDEIKMKRKQIFNRYLERLNNLSGYLILPINKFDTDWLAFPLMSKFRLTLLTFLEENNIQTRVCFAGNVTRHPAYREYLDSFPNSDKIMSDGFLLGAHHGMTIDDVDYVCDKIIDFFKR